MFHLSSSDFFDCGNHYAWYQETTADVVSGHVVGLYTKTRSQRRRLEADFGFEKHTNCLDLAS